MWNERYASDEYFYGTEPNTFLAEHAEGLMLDVSGRVIEGVYSNLLLVSGGNELRSGPWGSQAQLAAQIATAGFPVLRFDRRGVGDSEGQNTGFTGSADDIAAAQQRTSGWAWFSAFTPSGAATSTSARG